jgi:hypothetical protein
LIPDEVETPVVRGADRRMTVRGMTGLVLAVALFCGLLAAGRAHVRDWEARRARMDHQRDVTRSILQELMSDPSIPGRASPPFRDVRLSPSGTREWSEELTTLEDRKGLDRTRSRARVSGANGEFALKPITIEVHDPLLAGSWLDRLLREYRARGWPYRVIMPPVDRLPGR